MLMFGLTEAKINVGPWGIQDTIAATSYANMTAAGRRLAIKFQAPGNGPTISSIALRLVKTGSPTHTWTIGIWSDDSDIPNTELGTSAAQTMIASTAWTGFIDLATPVTLTSNVPYWIVLSIGTGTAPDGSNNLGLTHGGIVQNQSLPDKLRTYNGTDWTTVAVANGMGYAVFSDAQSNYYPLVWSQSTALTAMGAATHIFGDNVQGIRFKIGTAIRVKGFRFYTQKASSPGALVCSVYCNNELKGTYTIAAANVISGQKTYFDFGTGHIINPGSYLYLIFSQAAGDDSNDYSLQGWACAAGLVVIKPDYDYVWGLKTQLPSDLTVINTSVLLCEVVVGQISSDMMWSQVNAPVFKAGGETGIMRTIGKSYFLEEL